jgi:acetoacetyl-CoA synthetase
MTIAFPVSETLAKHVPSSPEMLVAPLRPGVESTSGQSANVERLIRIWSRILQVSPISEDSNFFDLGGDSLLAVGLLLEIELETGRKFPITAIYDAPTIADQAALIDSSTPSKFSPLVLLKPGEGNLPFFIVHGLGGTVIELAGLGKHIRSDSPVYAIQARGLDGGDTPLESVEDMAAFYVDAVREFQPSGPYLLGGYSFGGLVALEMARILDRARENVALLMLIDAYAHPRTWPILSKGNLFRRKTMNRASLFTTRPASESLSFLGSRLNALMARTAPGRRSVDGPPTDTIWQWPQKIDPNLPLPLRQVHEASSAALLSYTPRFYNGKIIFLKARNSGVVFPGNPGRIWRGLAREFELYTVSGDHVSAIHKHSDEVAERISNCMMAALKSNSRLVRPETHSAGSWPATGVLHQLGVQ